MYQDYKLGIVIPVYNEEALIEETLNGMPSYADALYVVNDASTDATQQIMENLYKGRFNILFNQQNQGVGAAIMTGYKQALKDGMDIVVVMAGDNQMDSQYLPELLEPIVKERAGYTKGNRLSSGYHQGMSTWRLLGNLTLTTLTKVVSGNWRVGDTQNGYTAITEEALRSIDLDSIYPRYGYCNDLIVKLSVSGVVIEDVPIPAHYGLEKSKIKYIPYIITLLFLLLRLAIWRIRR